MTPRLNVSLLVIAMLIGLPFYWLMIDNRPGNPEARPVTIVQLRTLAASIPGEPPSRIAFEAVAWKQRVRALSAAGRGLRPDRYYIFAYRLERPGKPPIVIDTGITRKRADDLEFGWYDQQAQARVVSALLDASNVVTLGPGGNHTGGLRLLSHIAPEQAHALASATRKNASSGPYAIAPGVVVIPTPDRLRGTTLVYVRRADGAEFVFAGDLSPTRWNIDEMRAPARLATRFSIREDRQAVFDWLHTVRLLKAQAPPLTIVSGNRIPADRGLRHGFAKARARKQAGGNHAISALSGSPKAR